jgi:hypothetical protein
MVQHVPLATIENFLSRKGWNVYKQTSRFTKYGLDDSGYDEPVYLTLPHSEENDSDAAVLLKAVDFISDFYEYASEDLSYVLGKGKAVFSAQLIDETTRNGEVPFVKFENHIQEIKNLLLNSASFSVHKRHYIVDVPEEANSYLNSCSFLQTAVGSFVSKVQLPNSSNLSTSLFPEYTVQTDAVNSLLGNVLEFAVNDIYNAREEDIFSVEHVTNHADIININVLENVNNIFRKTGVSEINFNLLGPELDFSIKSGPVGGNEFKQLDQYIELAQAVFSKQFDIEAYGKITQLRSSDTSGDGNLVVINRFQRGLKPLHVVLSSSQYDLAITAHKTGSSVYVKGIASETKKYLRVTRLTDFKLR